MKTIILAIKSAISITEGVILEKIAQFYLRRAEAASKRIDAIKERLFIYSVESRNF